MDREANTQFDRMTAFQNFGKLRRKFEKLNNKCKQLDKFVKDIREINEEDLHHMLEEDLSSMRKRKNIGSGLSLTGGAITLVGGIGMLVITGPIGWTTVIVGGGLVSLTGGGIKLFSTAGLQLSGDKIEALYKTFNQTVTALKQLDIYEMNLFIASVRNGMKFQNMSTIHDSYLNLFQQENKSYDQSGSLTETNEMVRLLAYPWSQTAAYGVLQTVNKVPTGMGFAPAAGVTLTTTQVVLGALVPVLSTVQVTCEVINLYKNNQLTLHEAVENLKRMIMHIKDFIEIISPLF